jgi:hypothetical protein
MKAFYGILAALLVFQVVTAQTTADVTKEFDVCLTPDMETTVRAVASAAMDQRATDSLQKVISATAPSTDELRLLPINLQIVPIWRRRWRCVIYYFPYKWCCWYVWWWF